MGGSEGGRLSRAVGGARFQTDSGGSESVPAGLLRPKPCEPAGMLERHNMVTLIALVTLARLMPLELARK